jgi:hypothetical protein
MPPATLWLDSSGRLIVNADGKPILCEVCPCGAAAVCPGCGDCASSYTVAIPAFDTGWICYGGIEVKVVFNGGNVTCDELDCEVPLWHTWEGWADSAGGTEYRRYYGALDCSGSAESSEQSDVYAYVRIYCSEYNGVISYTAQIYFSTTWVINVDTALSKSGGPCPDGIYTYANGPYFNEIEVAEA